MITDELKVKEFLRAYADLLREFDLPASDFPVRARPHMAMGLAMIETADGRHVASVQVAGDCSSCSMPLGPATWRYAKLIEMSLNALAELVTEKDGHADTGTTDRS